MSKLTETQIRALVTKEFLDKDPEFRTSMEAYSKMLNEFGNIKPPIYLSTRLEEINFIVKGRLNSNNLIQ